MNKLLIGLGVFLAAFIGVMEFAPPSTGNDSGHLVTDGVFVCMINGKTEIAWRTTNGQYLYDGKWRIYNPTAKGDVIYKQSQFESCAVLPIAKEEESDKKESIPPTTASQTGFKFWPAKNNA